MIKSSLQFFTQLSASADPPHNLLESKNFRFFNNVSVAFKIINASSIELVSIICEKPSEGDGTKVMSLIVRAADLSEINLILHATPIGAQTLSSLQLETWYSKFGFQTQSADYSPVRIAHMIRKNKSHPKVALVYENRKSKTKII